MNESCLRAVVWLSKLIKHLVQFVIDRGKLGVNAQQGGLL